ncbi:MAG: hypothetical protein CMO80_16115 [Verrucomicrobiales bacterium]|nr:hypothetical protein [Verrucomicrobiales bacterium]|tara:strand:+ start:1690 stop:2139 length:450 start_codon:yes stop_codon:yes gene_type:complete
MNMHVGFYLETNGGTPQNTEIYKALNKAVEENDVEDASVFYNNVDFNPTQSRFGMFNSADIWSFTGLLVATSLQNVARAANIVNKFKLAYLYSPLTGGTSDIFELMAISDKIPVITKSQEDADEVYRLTANKPLVLENFSVKDIIKVLS